VLPAGTEVGGYRVVRKIGKGGMATVYEAEQVSLDRVAALKVLAAEFGDDEVFRQRFERERKAQAELDHPNIVTVFDGGPSECGQWLAMQLIRGQTLAEVLELGRLAPETVWKLLFPIADALEAAHRKGVIHRDITPRNILVADDGTPFLADFGLTKRLGELSLTEPGWFLGTPQYVAPEQLREDQPVGPASDVYSLTAVLFKCLCGRPPFERGSRTGYLYAHLWDSPPAPSTIDGGLPSGLDAVIAKGMAKEPTERFRKPSELIGAARESFEGAALDDAAPSPRWAGRVRRPRWSPRLAGVALLLFALGLAAGALAAGRPRQPERFVHAGPLRVAIPAGWTVETGVARRFPNLHLADPLTLVAGGGKGPEVATVGTSLARGETLLPAALRPYGSHPTGVPISLGSLQALRYDGLGPKPRAEPWTVVVAPTSVGVATIVCRAGRRGGAGHRVCQDLAATLKLRDGVGYPVGPSSQLASLLRHQVGKLDHEVRRLRGRLRRASGSGIQAAAASALARAFRRCATTLAATPVSPQSAAHLAALVSGARLVRDAYKRLAAAARSGNGQAFRTESGEVYLTESILYNRILYLGSLGYRVAQVH
jgi:tRNA A-37 threonylcarbamoyl transferase component Bud32